MQSFVQGDLFQKKSGPRICQCIVRFLGSPPPICRALNNNCNNCHGKRAAGEGEPAADMHRGAATTIYIASSTTNPHAILTWHGTKYIKLMQCNWNTRKFHSHTCRNAHMQNFVTKIVPSSSVPSSPRPLIETAQTKVQICRTHKANLQSNSYIK